MGSSTPSNTNATPLDSGTSGDVHPHQRQIRKSANLVGPIFFNPTLKLAALRIALVTSASVLGSLATLFIAYREILDHEPSRAYMGITPFILIHHFLSAFKLRLLFRMLDLGLVIAEIVLLIKYKNPVIPDSFDPTSFIILFVASWTLVAVLVFLVVCRFAVIIRHQGENLLQPFDLLEDSQRIKGIPITGFPAAYSILIGRSIWRTQFTGEGVVVRLLRGFIAGAFITALVGYGMMSLIIMPVQETALTPVRESRGMGLPFDQVRTVEPPTWNFGFLRNIFPGMNITGLDSPETFHQAVSASMLASNGSMHLCTHSPGSLVPDSEKYGYQFIHVSCPPDSESGSAPDVIIEVDYEPLWLGNSPLRKMGTSAVWVSVGFTTNTDFFTNKTTPIALPPSSHYLAGVDANIRKVLKRPALSGLGMFGATDTFVTAVVLDLVPDPLAFMNPPVYDMSANSSTFRLYLNPAPETVVLEDWRERSVLEGFSALGGLWTFLGGIFALLFGTSLMRIFFNARSLSIFGLAQRMEKDRIASKYLEQYPMIQEELNLPVERRGIMSLLQDHMIDVTLFEEAIEQMQTTKQRLSHLDDVEKRGSTTVTPDIQEVTNTALTHRQ